MCANVSHGVTAVINGATKVNPINGEPPGKNVQTNLAEQGVSETKRPVTKPQKPAASAVTCAAKMGNQQGSENGKNQQGSKKKEKKDTSQTSKSNSPNSDATSGKSKSPSVKKKSSPASPSKKIFKSKQPPVKQDQKEGVSTIKGASAPDQQCTQDVFTDARETMNGAGQYGQDKTDKIVGDSSSDNISFESVSCGTPLRVATPRVQRAQPKTESAQLVPANPVDSVDELGKSIERAIMERFSDDPSVSLELGSQSARTKSTAEATTSNEKVVPVEQKNVLQRHEEEAKTVPPHTNSRELNISNAAYHSPPTVDVTKPQEISKPVSKIKIEPTCLEQGSEEKSKPNATGDAAEDIENIKNDTANSKDTNIVTPCAVEQVKSKNDRSSVSVSKNSNNVTPPVQHAGTDDKSTALASKDASSVDPSKVEHFGTENDKASAFVSKDTTNVTSSETENVTTDNNQSNASVLKDRNNVTPSSVDHVGINNDKSSAFVSKDTNNVTLSAVEQVGAQSVTEIAKADTKHMNVETLAAITKTPGDILPPPQPTEDLEMSLRNKTLSEGIFERDVEPEIPELKRDNRLKEITPSPIVMEPLETKETTNTDSAENATGGVSLNSPVQSTGVVQSVAPYDLVCDTSVPANSYKSQLMVSEKSDTESSDVSPVTDLSVDSQTSLTTLFISEPDIIKAQEDNKNESLGENSKSMGKGSVSAEVKPVSGSDQEVAVKPRDFPRRRWPAADTSSVTESSSRSMTLAEKRQHRLTDPLVDTLLLLIKQTMESDDVDSQSSATASVSKTGHSKTGSNPDIPKHTQVPSQGNIEENKPRITGETKNDEDVNKTLTPEDMAEFERLKQEAMAAEESTDFGGMDDDTLTQEDLAEFDRLKKEMSKAAKNNEFQSENNEKVPLHVEDRFELSSGETTEDSVIERPVQKAPDLETTREEKLLESQSTSEPSSVTDESKPEEVIDLPEIPTEPKPESSTVRKRSMTEDEIRREIRRFMIPEMKESLPNGGSMKQMLNDLHDITPTSEFYPSMDDRDSTDSPEQGNSSGLRSRTSITSSELDISEQRDDMSTGTDSMYADDEDDSSSEVLFCKTYTEPVRGAEVLVSCTVVNSALKEGNSSSDEFWAENSAAEDSYQQVEFAAAAVNHHFTHARSQMQDIQHHLQALKYQMRDMEKQVVKTNVPPTDEFVLGAPERRAVTD